MEAQTDFDGTVSNRSVIALTLETEPGKTILVTLTDANGNLVSQMRFTPFGEELTWAGSGESPTDFGFTGQRNEGGFGLMDYNARFYSASLGRFISADSIIPGAFNPMAFDRFSYVFNNPLNSVDPSGHRTCTTKQAATGDETCNQNIPPSPTSVDPDKLTNTSKVTGVGGEQMYWLYQQLWEDKGGWWWNTFGADGTFDVWDFLALMMYYEGGGIINGIDAQRAADMREGAIRSFYEYCETVSGGVCSSVSAETVFNYIGYASESMADRYKQIISGSSTLRDQFYQRFIDEGGTIPDSVDAFVAYANMLRNPPSDWRTGWAADRPYNWGNLTNPLAINEANNHAGSIPIWIGDGAFFVGTGCQWYYIVVHIQGGGSYPANVCTPARTYP